MTRPKARGSIPLEDYRKAFPDQRAVTDLMTHVEEDKSWFKISNKAKDTSTTEVLIYDEIGMWGTNAQDFVKQMMAIDTANIDLHLNSPGGEVFDAVAIYNALKAHPSTVNVFVDSLAASAASFIAQAGDTVAMSRNATMMIHDAGAICMGNQQDMLDTANLLGKLSNNIADIYAQRAGGTIEDWRAFMQEETWYTAQEAVDAGLADTVSGEGTKAKNKWDLSIFNHAGRSDAPSPESVRERVLSNRVKEAHMPKTPEELAAEQLATEAAAKKVVDDAVAKALADDKAEREAIEAAKAAESAAAKLGITPSNKAGELVVNIAGVQVTDATAIKTYIATLEGFQTETKSAARKNFVASLASSNTIGAAQIGGLETFVASLSDAQYEGWTATWDVAVTLPLLGNHTGGNTNLNGDAGQQDERLDIVRAIVGQHKRSGMPVEQIKATDSYNELMKLDTTFQL